MTYSRLDLDQLAANIKFWGKELGFAYVGITDIDLSEAEAYLNRWLANDFHGDMHYMSKHGTKRSRPAELIPNTARIISVRMDYLAANTNMIKNLQDDTKGYISRYALGKDYHKVVKKRLLQLSKRINATIGEFNYRAFVDSAPVLEKAIAEKSGMGWIGKNTLLINPKAGSWFFLGEIYVDLPLPVDSPTTNHCGSCTACIDICPTQAIIGPYQLDARRCISYLTIESKAPIPIALRKQIGNRIFGCDDCQIMCPWNKFAKFTDEADFHPRAVLTDKSLISLFSWSEAEFLHHTEGSAIRRTGYIGWLRNIAVALGNATRCDSIIAALQGRLDHDSELVREHVRWALEQQQSSRI